MHEQSKAAKRRSLDSAFRERYFVGKGLDIGAGADALSPSWAFCNITGCAPYDVEDGDAQMLPGIAPESFDFIHSSHCLEHLEQPLLALERWIQVVKRGGHLILTIPDSAMYERGLWPSRFSGEHKWRFCVDWSVESGSLPRLLSVLDVTRMFIGRVTLEHLKVVRDHFDPNIADTVDQTMGPAECAIEFVLRRI